MRLFAQCGAARLSLILKVSKTPLRGDEQGVSVYSSGVCHTTTLGSSQGKELGLYVHSGGHEWPSDLTDTAVQFMQRN